MMNRLIFPRPVWIVLFYSGLALFFTWPLARHFTTHMPGNGIDDPALGWNLWWLKARLVDQLNPDIFHVDWMFHPIQINLAFYTLTPLNGLLSVPLQLGFNLIIANNLVLLSSFVLSGYGAFLLVEDTLRQTVRRGDKEIYFTLSPCHLVSLSALFAGLIYAFSSTKLFYAALGQYNIASSQWIPFCVLYVLRIGRATTPRRALRNASLAALFLVLQAWSELTYASFLLIFIAIYFCFVLMARRHSPFTILPFFFLALLFLLGLTPFLWAMLPDLRGEGDFFTSGGGFSDVFSADLAGYLVPTRLHPLLGNWVASLPFPNDVGQHIFIGYSVMVIALLGAVTALRNKSSQWRVAGSEVAYTQYLISNSGAFWLFNTIFFWWLTLGPRLRWLGHALPIPGPFALISLLPFFNGNRYPSRYSVMLLLCVAMLSGWGCYALLQKLAASNRRFLTLPGQALSPCHLVTLSFALLFTAEHLSLPLPLNDFRVPGIYTKLAAQPGDFALLELPTGWRNGARVLGKSDKLIMMQEWYQTVHGKQRLGGNTSRNPPYKFQYFTNAPLIGDLIALMNADPAAQPPDDYLTRFVTPALDEMIRWDRAIAPQVLALLNIRYVTLHVEKTTPALRRLVEEALPVTLVDEWQGTDWDNKASTIRLYAVTPTAPPTDWSIDLAAPVGNLYLAEGWSTVTAPGLAMRYATRQTPTLFLPPLPQAGQLTLTLTTVSPLIGVTLNGEAVAWQQGTAGAGATSQLLVNVPAQSPHVELNRLQLHFAAQPRPVTNLLPAPDPRGWPLGQTGAFLPPQANLVVQSAGKDVGDFAHIWVKGQDVARQQRGYNLVALDGQGQVAESVVFDTLAPGASAAMAAWLQRWAPGTMIAGAVMDEASLNLGEDAVAALAQVGVVNDLQKHFRWSHAFIGVVGAPPGTALEQASLLTPATVFVGLPVDGAEVYGAVGTIHYRCCNLSGLRTK